MILKRCNKLCHPSRLKLPLFKSLWFRFGIPHTWFGLLGPGWFGQITSPEQLGGCGTRVSSLGFCLLMIIFITASLSSKMYNCVSFSETCAFQGTWSMFNRSTFWSNTSFSLGCDLGLNTGFPCLVFFGSFPALQWPNSTSQAQVIRPCANQHPTTWSLILWSCEILTFASCTSNWSVQMFDFQKRTKLRLMLILSLQDLLQSLNHEITPTNRQYWAALTVCSLTTEWQVDAFVSSTSIVIQYGSKLLTIHLYFPTLPFWFGDRRHKGDKLWKVAPSFCLTNRSTIPRIFEHVLPCRRTTLKFLREVAPA